MSVDVDMTPALAAKGRTPGTTVTDVLLSSCAQALKAHPALNAHFGDDAVTVFDRVNLGIAVATDAGLVVPVIHDVQDLDLTGIAAARRDVVERARAGKLSMADVSGGTFTVSNLGMLGVDYFDAILNAPQVAILAVGATRQQYLYNDGEPTWRPLARMTLTCDHRTVDGATRAGFLALLASPDPCPEWGWLRVYRAEPTAAFSRRDTLAPGYRLAAAAARRHHFVPVVRRRLAWEPRTVVSDHVPGVTVDDVRDALVSQLRRTLSLGDRVVEGEPLATVHTFPLQRCWDIAS